MSATFDTPVLIVGAGPVGLALALDLAYHGVKSTVIEQDRGTGTEQLAKAGGLNERTLEFCRKWGIRERVVHWGGPEDHPKETCYCTSLTGHIIGRDQSVRDQTQFSPERWTKCPQFVFDPLLAEMVGRTDLATIRYSTRFDGLTQDDDGVTADLTDLQSGRSLKARAQFLVGCDGAGSLVREEINVPFDGKTLDYSVSVMIRIAEFERYHNLGQVERFMFVGPQGTWANITSVDYRDIWRFVFVGSKAKLDLAHFDIAAEMRRAFGSIDVPFEILRIVPWQRSQKTAGRFRVGRVLLAGDAAHTTSPTGGHGLNTGLGDVSALGWMLAALAQGWGGPTLLDAYDQERRPIAVRNGSSSTKNYTQWVGGTDYSLVLADGPEGEVARERIGDALSAGLKPEWKSLGIVLGYRYENSPVIVPDGVPPPPDDPSDYIPTARPGHRVPHAWLPDGRSTLDLFTQGYTLLRLGAAPPDIDALLAAAKRCGMPLRVVDIDKDEITELYDCRLLLVRPDGHSVWRGETLPQDVDQLVDTVRGAVSQAATRHTGSIA